MFCICLLSIWTAPSGVTATDQFLYDNEGNHVLQHASITGSGTTTTSDTITFDGDTEIVISGGNSTVTKYYNINGQHLGVRNGAILSYLLPDFLGSSVVALKYDGTMPTTYNFTEQRLDSVTGLLYYNARYYDPVSGRFTSADTVQNNPKGMDPYAYVGDNPVGRNDPNGTLLAAVYRSDWGWNWSPGRWSWFYHQSDS